MFTKEELEFIRQIINFRKLIISSCIPQLKKAIEMTKQEKQKRYKEKLENEKYRLIIIESILSKING